MKKKILATTCAASGTAQLTEIAQTGQGLETFCLDNNIFETNPKDELVRFKNYLLTNGIRAVIFDNCWLPGKATGITIKQLEFAKEMHGRDIEVFFLCRGNESLICELWQAYKPIRYPDMEVPTMSLIRLAVFISDEVFDSKTGKVYERSGGDGGWNQVQHAVREYLAFHERDWPKIVAVVEKELAL